MIPMQSHSLTNITTVMVLVFLLICTVNGARRGLIGAVIGLVSKVVAVFGASWLAKLCAPMLMPMVTEQLTQLILTSDMIQELKTQGILSEEMIAQTAARITQGLVYVVLTIVIFFVLTLLLSFAARALNVFLRFPPLGLLNRLGGAVIGLVGGILVLMLAAWMIRMLRPEIFAQLGGLDLSQIQQSELLRSLQTYFPDLPVI